MHSASFFAASLHWPMLVMSPAEAQQPSMAVSSRAQTWTCGTRFGLTLSCHGLSRNSARGRSDSLSEYASCRGEIREMIFLESLFA